MGPVQTHEPQGDLWEGRTGADPGQEHRSRAFQTTCLIIPSIHSSVHTGRSVRGDEKRCSLSTYCVPLVRPAWVSPTHTGGNRLREVKAPSQGLPEGGGRSHYLSNTTELLILGVATGLKVICSSTGGKTEAEEGQVTRGHTVGQTPESMVFSQGWGPG